MLKYFLLFLFFASCFSAEELAGKSKLFYSGSCFCIYHPDSSIYDRCTTPLCASDKELKNQSFNSGSHILKIKTKENDDEPLDSSIVLEPDKSYFIGRKVIGTGHGRTYYKIQVINIKNEDEARQHIKKFKKDTILSETFYVATIVLMLGGLVLLVSL